MLPRHGPRGPEITGTGNGFTVTVFVANVVPHKPPPVVNVSVTNAGAPAAAV